MNTLTKVEEEVMQKLWKIGEGNVTQIMDEFSDPKPAYNTVSTMIRILENKEFVSHKQQGRGYIYFPLISKEAYSEFTAQKLAESYFGGSFKQMVSFFVKNEQLDLKELEEIIQKITK